MPVWYKIVVSGSTEALRGFLAGYAAAGLQPHQGVVLGSDIPLAPARLSERLQQLLATGKHQVLLAPRSVAPGLIQALTERGPDADICFLEQTEVRGGRFSVDAKVFSRELGVEIRKILLEDVPEGADISGLQVEQHINPAARGPELYTTAHDFELRIKGEVCGTLTAVLEMHRRAVVLEDVQASPVALET